jgi:hypothetical protein
VLLRPGRLGDVGPRLAGSQRGAQTRRAKPENVDLIIVLRLENVAKGFLPPGARGNLAKLKCWHHNLVDRFVGAARVTTSINTVCVRARKIRTTKYRDRAKVLGRQ